MKDILGAFFSGLCICHCILTPMIIMAGGLGVMGTIFHSEWVHYVLLVPIVLLVFSSLPKSQKIHQQMMPIVLGTVGLLSLFLGLCFEGVMETVFSICGGLLLCAAHMSNRRFLMAVPKTNTDLNQVQTNKL